MASLGVQKSRWKHGRFGDRLLKCLGNESDYFSRGSMLFLLTSQGFGVLVRAPLFCAALLVDMLV